MATQPVADQQAVSDQPTEPAGQEELRPWKEKPLSARLCSAAVVVIKLAAVLTALFTFVCSLTFMSAAFRLLAGKSAGHVFSNSEFLLNPIVGLLVGVLVTVLVQSSSTSTSIIITMAGADLLTVREAAPMIMGANIGTSVTSTLVALGQVGEREEFRRAFAAATVHDMFNFLTVAVVLPLQWAFGLLSSLAHAMVEVVGLDGTGGEGAEPPPDILKALTKPVTSLFIKVDSKVISAVATASTEEDYAALEDKHILVHLFGMTELSDFAAGLIALLFAVVVLCVALFLVVALLKSLLKGRAATWLHTAVNGQVPDLPLGKCTVPLGWLSGYLALLAGMLITVCVQSSSVTTSTLTPFVGIGVISLERMYPTVLGANLGTTVTGLLAAFAADPDRINVTLQVAFVHLLFNVIGISIWYVIWPLRALPIGAARHLGSTTAKYRWFAVAYILACFFIIPVLVMLLSLGGPVPFTLVLVLFGVAGLAAATLSVLQSRCKEALPLRLRSWDFLPPWLASLEPYDRLVCGPLSRCCCKRRGGSKAAEGGSSTAGGSDGDDRKVGIEVR